MQARRSPALPRPARGGCLGEVLRRVLPPIWGLRPMPLILQLICGDVQYGNMRTLHICRTGAFRRGQDHRGNYVSHSNLVRRPQGRSMCHRPYTSRACAGSRDVCWFYRVCISVSWVTPTFSLVQIGTFCRLECTHRTVQKYVRLHSQVLVRVAVASPVRLQNVQQMGILRNLCVYIHILYKHHYGLCYRLLQMLPYPQLSTKTVDNTAFHALRLSYNF